jgi:hypothetical protein
MTSNLDNALNEILFDVQFRAGAFADDSLASDEIRDLAVEKILALMEQNNS